MNAIERHGYGFLPSPAIYHYSSFVRHALQPVQAGLAALPPDRATVIGRLPRHPGKGWRQWKI
jgi:hypothetical protein